MPSCVYVSLVNAKTDMLYCLSAKKVVMTAATKSNPSRTTRRKRWKGRERKRERKKEEKQRIQNAYNEILCHTQMPTTDLHHTHTHTPKCRRPFRTVWEWETVDQQTSAQTCIALHSHCVRSIIELIKLKCENLIWKMVFIIQYILNNV